MAGLASASRREVAYLPSRFGTVIAQGPPGRTVGARTRRAPSDVPVESEEPESQLGRGVGGQAWSTRVALARVSPR